jgi:hypothetical protein
MPNAFSTLSAYLKKDSALSPEPHESWPECELIITAPSALASEVSLTNEARWSCSLLDRQYWYAPVLASTSPPVV